MKFLFLFLVALNSYAGGEKPIAPNCDQIVEEMDDSALLVALLVKMHEERVILDEDLERFYMNLMEGKLVNPIPLQNGPYGPVITSGKDLVFYKTFQALIESNHQIDRQIVIQQLKEINQDLKRAHVERGIIHEDTNVDFRFIGNLHNMSPYSLSNFANDLVKKKDIEKKYLKGLDYLGEYLSSVNNKRAQEYGFLIQYYLNPNKEVDELIEQFRANYSDLQYTINSNRSTYLKLSDENFEKLAIVLISESIPSDLLLDVLSRAKNQICNQFVEKVKQIIFSDLNRRHYREIVYLVNFLRNKNENQVLELLNQLRTSNLFKNNVMSFIIQYAFDHNYEEFEKKLLTLDNSDFEFTLNDNFFIQDMLRSEDVAKLFKIAFNHQNSAVRNKAIESLSLYRYRYYDDKETIPLVKFAWETLTFDDVPWENKLKSLTGVDEPWAWQLIRRLQDNLLGKLNGDENLISMMNGTTSRESRDLIDSFFDRDTNILRGFDILDSRSKSDLYYFLEKYKTKYPLLAVDALIILFYKFNERSKDFNNLAKEMIMNNVTSRSFLSDFLLSLDKNESIEFHNKLMEIVINSTNNLPKYIYPLIYTTLDQMELRNEIYSFIAWLDENKNTVGIQSSLYVAQYFLAFEKLFSQDPTEAALAKKIFNEFDANVFPKY